MNLVIEKIEKIKKPRKKVTDNKELINISAIEEFFNNIQYEKSMCSCGIIELEEVNSFYKEYILYTNQKTKDYLKNNFKKLLKSSLKIMNEENNYFNMKGCFYMISLPVTSKKELIDMLDEIGEYQTGYRRNPNSSNQIKIWIL